MLVYGRKEEAVRALTSNEQFMQNVDYQVLRKNAENPKGGRPTVEYYLSVSCLEYFIVRKVRPVFEVYRQIFHKVAESYIVPQTFGEALMLAAKRQLQVEEQQKQLEANAAEIMALNDKVGEMQPKATYYDQILKSKNTILVTQIAKDYGYSAQQFNKLLETLHIQYKLRGQWILYAEHAGNGYTKSKSVSIQYNDGTLGTKLHTEWTQKGRLFLYERLKANNILPLIEQ